MSSRKINIKNSSFGKKDLFDALDFAYLAMRSYRNCAMSNKVYCVNNDFEKCVKCVRLSRDCNLTISSISIKRIHEKRLRLKKNCAKRMLS